MKLMIRLLWVWLLLWWWFSFADYSYTNRSICNGADCSIETCDVTEFEEYTQVTVTEYPDGDISSELYEYLVSQGEYTFANWLAWSVCISDNTYTETSEELISPDPVHECIWSVPICGDGIVDSALWEACDLWIDDNWWDSTCTDSCQRNEYCGDSIVQVDLGEECDPLVDKEYCDEATCLFVPWVPVDLEFSVRDPIECGGHFYGGIVLGDGSKNFEWVTMHLDVKCEGSDRFVPLHPVIDSEGNYTAAVEYEDTSSERYLIGECEVRYWWCLKIDEKESCTTITFYDTLKWVCQSWSGWSWYVPAPELTSSSWWGGWVWWSISPIDWVTRTSFTNNATISGEEFSAAPISWVSKLYLDPKTPFTFPVNGTLLDTWAR